MISLTHSTPRHDGSSISARPGIASPVGNHRHLRCLVLTAIGVLVAPSAALAAPWSPTPKLLPTGTADTDNVGYGVDIAGGTAVIGAPRATGAIEPEAGAAYVYIRDPQTGLWNEVARLTASDGASFNEFGQAVGIGIANGSSAADRIIVGAPFGGPQFSNEGAAYLFELDPQTGAWPQVARLANPSPDQDAWFGWCVAIDGDRAVVGSPQDGDTDYQAGSVTVFLRDSGTGVWAVERELYSSDPGFYELFGTSADIAGDTVVAGEPQDSALSYWSGAAFIYERDPVTGWETTQKILPPIGASDVELFGEAVAIAASGWLAVSAPNDDGRGTNGGAVHLFARDAQSGTFTYRETVYGSEVSGNDQFGKSLDLDAAGGQLIAGSPWDGTFGSNEGAAYIFKLDVGSGTWTEDGLLRAADRETGDWFGFASAISDDGYALVGVPYDDDRGDRSGAAWIFEDEGAGGSGPSIAITGPCPGQMAFDITGVTPGGRVALVAGGKVGSYVVPSGPCAGARLDLVPPYVAGVPFILQADATGAARLVTDVPANACGVIRVQAVDVTTCEVGDLVVVE